MRFCVYSVTERVAIITDLENA